MLKVSIYALIAVAAIVLGIQSNLFSSKEAASVDSNPKAIANDANVHLNFSGGSAPLTKPFEGSRTLVPSQSQPISIPPTASLNSKPLEPVPIEQESDQQSDEITSEYSGPMEVAGRPFPISKSVINECVRNDAGTACDDPVVDYLRAMEQEPRDLEWAAEIEKRLRRFLKSLGDEITIRNIECRTSRCAIEFSSLDGEYDGSVSKDEWLRRNLSNWGGIDAHEMGNTGVRITVSLVVYKRR